MWCRQLKVISWKNFIIRRRHWFLLMCEAAIPVILFLLVAYGRSKITGLSKQEVVDVTFNEKYPIRYDTQGFNLGETQIYYSPSNKYYEDIIHRVQEKFQIINNNIRGFDNEESLLDSYARNNNYTIIAIIFNSLNKTSFEYTIRYHKQYFSWGTDRLYANELMFQPGVGSKYLWEGFIILPMALDMSFIEKEMEERNQQVPAISLEALEFPYPPHKADSGLSSIFSNYYPLITLFSFIFVCPAVLKRVVEEKHSGIKELMKMVGMKPSVLWIGWFIYSLLPMIVSVSAITIILKVDFFDAGYPPIEYADGSVLFIFLVLYCMASITVCFSLSSLFDIPTLATLVGLLVWILSYFVPKYMVEDFDSGESRFSLSANIVCMLLPNMALHYGYGAMSRYEEREIGVKWTNMHIPGGGGSNEVTMLQVFLMLIVDCVIYMLLALYVDNINPGKYGIPESFFYPIKSVLSKIRRNSVKNIDDVESFRLKKVEKGQCPKGIQLIGLTKKYGKQTVVDNLTMDIDRNRITVLLGHNGAGKSTTMGMITGMVKKTSGLIFLNGKQITSSSDVTDSIGLCPQHNLFFPDLTVAEHLKFFAMLKGRSCTDAERELKSLLESLNLKDKRNERAHNLSGGMKRKLCLGMAVIGGSKILILDEPSSGMDIESRRYMWDLLLKWRNERTILITTHFMEEADALADYICIMDEGKLSSHGTPFDLKRKYETGYNLSLIVRKDQDPNLVAELFEREIKTYIDSVKRKAVNGHEVVFLIPCSDENVNKNCQKVFEYLETCKDQFKLENISLSNTTLEDVFLKSRSYESNESSSVRPSEPEVSNRLTMLMGLPYKRFSFLRRKCWTHVIPLLIAVFFLALCIFLGQGTNYSSKSGGPPFKMVLSSYGKTKVYFKESEDAAVKKMTEIYKGLVTNEKSIFHTVNDVSEAIVKEGVSNLPFYRHHMIASAEMSLKDYGSKKAIEAVLMYNNVAIHSAPISLNLITNTIAKFLLGEEYSIRFTNHPLDNINSHTVDQLDEVQIGLLWLTILPLGILFFLGSFIYFPYVELSTNFVQLQLMCGIWPSVYWTVTFVCDLILYVLFAFVMAVICLIWVPFRGVDEFGTFFLILTLYGVAGIPFSYLFSRKKSFTGAYAFFIILGMMLGVVLTVIVMVLQESGEESYMNTGNILRTIFVLFNPQFGLTYSSVVFAKKAVDNYNFVHMPRLQLLSVCSREDANACCSGSGPACDEYKSYLSVLSPYIWFMILEGAFFLLLNILLHNYTVRRVFNDVTKLVNYWRRKRDSRSYALDIEKGGNNNFCHNSSSSAGNDRTLRVTKLRKAYSGRDVVSDVDFDLKKGEVLGILGVNGAGKSTTFRMLTRDEIKDDGDVQINNINIDKDKYLEKLGYCPQNDALNLSLTGREILTTMAMLRGIDVSAVDNYLEVFGLKELENVCCEFYSGGNKRKLSLAVAIIGLPPFILLDEPTTGVDPSSRRKIWNLIKGIKDAKKNSFMLTSHSMTECEALCDNLKIMKQGTIRRQGTIAKLKNEISGYSAKLKLHVRNEPRNSARVGNDDVDGESVHLINDKSSDGETKIENVDDLVAYLTTKYEGEVKDQHSGLLHFYIKDKHLKWSQLFREFEELKLKSNGFIEDYMVSEASLEDVFLDVAKSDADV